MAIDIHDGQPDRFVSQHSVVTRTPDGDRFWILTGIALIGLEGTGSTWRREEINLGVTVPGIPRNQGLQLKQWTPFVTLNAIANNGEARNAGWAVDRFHLRDPRTPALQRVVINTRVAVRDSDGWIFRVGYTLHLIGSFVDVEGPI